MNHLVIESIIEKVEATEIRLNIQGKELSEVTKKISRITDQTNTIKATANLLKKLQDDMNTIAWPVKEMEEMTNLLVHNNNLLARPKKTKQVIVHTAGKLGWIIAGFSVATISLVIMIISVANKLDQYKRNDLMWRYIKLSNSSQNLEYLQSVERLYIAYPEKMKSLVEKEELRLKQIAESEITNRDYGSSDTTSVSNKKMKNKSKDNNNH